MPKCLKSLGLLCGWVASGHPYGKGGDYDLGAGTDEKEHAATEEWLHYEV